MRISFLGDIMSNKKQLDLCLIENKYKFEEALNIIKEDFQNSDFIIANLETCVAGEKLIFTKKRASLNAPIELIYTLKKLGVNLVQTSNNHCLDRGKEGLLNTIDNLEKIGLDYIGTHKKKEPSYKIIKIKNIKIGILAFTYGTNAFSNNVYLKKNEKYMVDLLQEQELSNKISRFIYNNTSFPLRVLKYLFRKLNLFQANKPVYIRTTPNKTQLKYLKNTIEACKKSGAEYIIALLHIGGQYNDSPTDYTKKMCEFCRINGVNAVIANHEHVIHTIDHKNFSENYFCEYSLGNFYSSAAVLDPPFDKLGEYSAVYHCDITEKNKAKFSFSIYINYVNENKKLIVENSFIYYSKIKDSNYKLKIYKELNILLNRIYNTENKTYNIESEYKIKYNE